MKNYEKIAELMKKLSKEVSAYLSYITILDESSTSDKMIERTIKISNEIKKVYKENS